MAFRVGSSVRISRGEGNKRTGRATIATISSEGEVCLFFDNQVPVPLHNSDRKFMICPTNSNNDDDEEEANAAAAAAAVVVVDDDHNETIKTLKELSALQDFEHDDDNSPEITDPLVLKERGDVLLKLGDAFAAIPFYEEALRVSNDIQVGSTVIFMDQNGDISPAAEIDCLEEDTADITFTQSQKEATVPIKRIRLGVSLRHSDLQIRTLMNLSRCLIQCADLETSTSSLRMALAYRQAAVQACYIAFAVLTSDPEDDEFTPLHSTCLLLGSKAQAACGKLQGAMNDANMLLKKDPSSKAARKWKQELIGLIKKQQNANKKLVKGMCAWIQTATDGNDVSDETPKRLESAPQDQIRPSLKFDWLTSALIIIIAVFVYQSLRE